ncbi:MAG TPA: Ig-like domain-containing protein, partial [Steroidobacteraceae bacterium]|nr:Ig-like domain-containing protein [Steroidobacteraceae bacterium]
MFVSLMSRLSRKADLKRCAVPGTTVARLVLAVVLGLWEINAHAYPWGIAGQSQAGCGGSGCHSGGSYNYNASFSGTLTVAPNATATINFNVTRNSGTKVSVAGLDVSVVAGTASAGVLAAGSNTRLTNSSSPDFDAVDGEIVQPGSPQSADANGNTSWDFLYTAPNAVGTTVLYGCGNPANGDGLNSGDGPSACTSQTVTINSSPTANNDSFAVDKNSGSYDFTTALTNDRSGNGSNDPGDSISITAITVGASHGTATRVNGTTLRYTPNAGYSGPDSFTYRITDSIGATDTATVNVTVVNHAPVANDNSYSVNMNSSLPVSGARNVLTNDTDQDGDSIAAVLVANPSHGTLTLNSNGTFAYQPTTGYN